jgi:hypothetical protein
MPLTGVRLLWTATADTPAPIRVYRVALVYRAAN